MTDVTSIISSTQMALEQRAAAAAEAARPKVHPDVAAAAEALGCPPAEITRVRNAREGVRVDLVDGTHMIIVPPDKPDGAGRIGVMFWEAPSRTYAGTMPVYAPHERRLLGILPPKPPTVTTWQHHPAELDEPTPDARLTTLLAVRDEAQAWVDDVAAGRRHQSEEAMAARKLDGAKRMVDEHRAQLQAAEFEANPPPPDPGTVQLMTGTVMWARAVLAAKTEWDLRAATMVGTDIAPAIWTFNPAFAALELDGATKWLNDHGLPLPDDDGLPPAA